jgi:hypothetical protein
MVGVGVGGLMADSTEKLGAFLREVSNMSWEDFVRAEHDLDYTSNQAMIFALIRSCAMEKMDAIRLAVNRLDGKLKTPIKVEYPKIFYQYPYAKLPETYTSEPESIQPGDESIHFELSTEVREEEPEMVENDLPSLSLRQTLTKMSGYSRKLPKAIVDMAFITESYVREQGPPPKEVMLVKSVVAAHLLIMAQGRDISAITEVFNNVDGKLVETIQILGENIFITSYATIAPEGAYINGKGIVEAEATIAQNLWAVKLGREISGE